MTIEERIKLEEKAIKDMQFKEEALDGLPGYMVTKEDYEECRKSAKEHQELINWLKELQSHKEAWEKVLDEMKDVSIPGQDAEYVYQNIYDIIRKYRPKEDDSNDNKE